MAKKTELEWNVFIGDVNLRSIRTHNVFDHGGVMGDLKKAARKYAKDKDAFAEVVRRSIMYHYWSKCEWEIVLQHWPPYEGFNGKKVDVYDQLALNWDKFVDYCWEHAVALRRREKKTDGKES